MSSARLPEHEGSTTFVATPAPPPAPDARSAGLVLAPALAPHTAHLVPCAGCGALNGRSALACWSCEADLLALAPFAQSARAAVEPVAKHVVEPETAVPVASAGASDIRLRLHLVSRNGAAVSVEAEPAAAEPEHTIALPVLTELVEDTPVVPQAQQPWRRHRPMIALTLAAIALLAAAAGLRWLVPPPGVAGVASAPTVQRAEAAVERPFSSPTQGDKPDRANLSFPPVDVVPARAAADSPAHSTAHSTTTSRARTPNSSTRPIPKRREIRETVSPPPAACTSNLAALGFCTLPPAAAKE